MKLATVVILLTLLCGCTHSTMVRFKVEPTMSTEFNQSDIDKIGDALVVQKIAHKTEYPGDYFMAEKTPYWEILSLRLFESNMYLKVQRVSGHVIDFSEEWKREFIQWSESFVEDATSKKVIIVEQE